MAYFMTDAAAGGQAALQMQENMAAAPYVGEKAAAAAEETQLKLQQDRLKAAYAPQQAAAAAEEEQMRLKTMRLQTLASETQYKADTDSTQKLQQWMETNEGKKATPSDITRKAAALKFEAGRTKEGAELTTQAEKQDATALANEAKAVAASNEAIAKAFVVVDALDPNDQLRFDEFINRLPSESTKAITDKVGVDNWKNFTRQEKKDVLSRLFLNGKGLLTDRVKAVELEKTKLIVKKDEDVAETKSNAAKAIATTHAQAAVDVADIVGEARIQAAKEKGAADLEKVKQQGEDALAREKQKGEDALARQKQKDKDDLELQKQKDADAMQRLKEQDASKERMRAAEDASKERMRKAEDESKERIKKVEDDSKERIEKMRDKTLKDIADAKLAAKDKPKADDPIKDEKFYLSAHDRVVKEGKEEQKILMEAVNKADAARQKAKTASWINPDSYRQDKYNTAYTEAVDKLNNFRKKQFKEEIELIKLMPDSPTKNKIIKLTQDKMDSIGVEEGENKPTTVTSPSSSAVAPATSATAAGKVGGATSNKFTPDQQTWFDAAKKANPTMSDADIIAEGKKRKKL